VNDFGRTFITGATGFIGGHLARRLILSEGAQVVALVRDPSKAGELRDLGVELVHGDITEPDGWRGAVKGCRVVYHSAAWVSESGPVEQVWATNVDGTQNVVDAAVAAGVERFIHVSTCGVYGSKQAFDIDESTPVQRSGNRYKDSKIAAEEAVFRACREHGLPVVAARASQVYGPGSYQFTIRPVEVIKSGKMILIDGGRFLCKPVYIDNLIDGLILCAQVEAAIGEAINLTDGYTVPWREFFGAYGRMLGVESFPSLTYPVAWLAALAFEIQGKLKGRKASFTRGAVNSLRSSNSFNNQKARHLLGWEPKVDLEEGMRRTQAWLEQEGYLED
jgi:nucleoside-diphosphate-sugar epimerase